MPQRVILRLKSRLREALAGGALGNFAERLAEAVDPSSDKRLAQLTLDSIGDAVIGTNVQGEVTYLNDVGGRCWAGLATRRSENP